MKLQSVNLFTEDTIFKYITQDPDLAEHFTRKGENYNLFTTQECYTEKQEMITLQHNNLVNLSVKINNKVNIGAKSVLNGGTLENKLYVKAEVVLYLFTYNPELALELDKNIEGLNTRRDYFNFVDAALRVFLQTRGLKNMNILRVPLNRIDAIENYYQTTFYESEEYLFNEYEKLKVKLSNFSSVNEK